MVDFFHDECQDILEHVKRLAGKRGRGGRTHENWDKIDHAFQLDVTDSINKISTLQQRLRTLFNDPHYTFKFQIIHALQGSKPQAPHLDFISGRGLLHLLHLQVQPGTEIYKLYRPSDDPLPSHEEPEIPLTAEWRRYLLPKVQPLFGISEKDWPLFLDTSTVSAGSLQILPSDCIHRGPGAIDGDRWVLFTTYFIDPDPFLGSETSWLPWNAAFHLYGLSDEFYLVCLSWLNHLPISYLPDTYKTRALQNLRSYLKRLQNHRFIKK